MKPESKFLLQDIFLWGMVVAMPIASVFHTDEKIPLIYLMHFICIWISISAYLLGRRPFRDPKHLIDKFYNEQGEEVKLNLTKHQKKN